MEPRGFRELARALAAGEATAAAYRTAIGRAYYAAFNTGAQLLREAGCRVPKGPEAHRDVPDLLALVGVHELSLAARDLLTLREQRNFADYDLDHTMPENSATAEVAIRQAESIIEALDEFVHNQSRYPSQLSAVRNESARRDQRRSLRRAAP